MADVIVLGLGAMGSSTAYHLAEHGHHVIGFDQFTPPHTLGSSHGETRIIRQSYYEDVRYVPLLLRAYELWKRLERDTGENLLRATGGLMIGAPEGELVKGSTSSAKKFDLPHEVLSANELRRRYPAFQVADDTVALWEREAGYLLPEACVRLHLEQAARAGAELHFDEVVQSWSVSNEGSVTVRTGRGVYTADQLVITAGPWAPQVLNELGLPLRVTRQVLYWFEPAANPELFHADRMPIYLFEALDQTPMLYGFPFNGPESAGAKVALHGSNDFCTPETVDRSIRAIDEAGIRERLASTLPSLAGRLIEARTCLYTMTPDEHFILDKHPEFPNVTLAAGFSGHGFKFASTIGEVLAGMATNTSPRFDLQLFSLSRFRGSISGSPAEKMAS